jgi:hypothetical protein
MRKSVELDTIKLASRLSEVRSRLTLAWAAVNGLEDVEQGAAEICNLLHEISAEVKAIEDAIHPPLSERQIVQFNRESEKPGLSA